VQATQPANSIASPNVHSFSQGARNVYLSRDLVLGFLAQMKYQPSVGRWRTTTHGQSLAALDDLSERWSAYCAHVRATGRDPPPGLQIEVGDLERLLLPKKGRAATAPAPTAGAASAPLAAAGVVQAAGAVGPVAAGPLAPAAFAAAAAFGAPAAAAVAPPPAAAAAAPAIDAAAAAAAAAAQVVVSDMILMVPPTESLTKEEQVAFYKHWTSGPPEATTMARVRTKWFEEQGRKQVKEQRKRSCLTSVAIVCRVGRSPPSC